MAARFRVELNGLDARSKAYPLDVRIALSAVVHALERHGPEFDDVVGWLGPRQEFEAVLIDVGEGDLEIAFVCDTRGRRVKFLELQPSGTLMPSHLEALARQASGAWAGPFVPAQTRGRP
jgi:hypothetical protein